MEKNENDIPNNLPCNIQNIKEKLYICNSIHLLIWKNVNQTLPNSTDLLSRFWLYSMILKYAACFTTLISACTS